MEGKRAGELGRRVVKRTRKTFTSPTTGVMVDQHIRSHRFACQNNIG